MQDDADEMSYIMQIHALQSIKTVCFLPSSSNFRDIFCRCWQLRDGIHHRASSSTATELNNNILHRTD